ncbi:MFS transporter [Streptomyces sp. LX-29]|uniref:MFS transporter n=1 Tax=Streptomyces sp. LX-29 TaxID=2900152 RepID=UPI00240DA13F|nr:MFS transporter [Streptomyces sp. LX-29]WFB08094.1 MFS transporter [Streptomyces sp. LX-29]
MTETRPTRLRHARAALAVSFFVQGTVFALLVTRIPALQDRYGVPDAWLPGFLAAVPVLAGLASLGTERLVRRVRPSTVLRWAQLSVCLALVAAGSGREVWQLGLALAAFGLAVGALDASMNMVGVGLQRAYGRSIIIGFHAAYSLGGIVGASLAWAGARGGLPLGALYAPVVAVLIPVALAAGRWYAAAAAPGPHPAPIPAPAPDPDPAPGPRAAAGPSSAGPRAGPGPGSEGEAAGPAPSASPNMRPLLPLCLVMAFAFIGDATVSNWSATYLQDVLHSSDALATVPYNLYMVTTLLGRAVGDLAVRRFGAVRVVRAGTLLAAGGFAVVAAAPGAAVGLLGFTLLGLGLCAIVPQTIAAAGWRYPEPRAAEAAVARLNVFNYVGFLVGSPLVGALGAVWSLRGAMLVPMTLVLATLGYARQFGDQRARYGEAHERPRAVDVG